MAVAFVKNVGTSTSGNATTIAVTVPASGVAAGNTLVVRIASTADEAISGIADTAGNTYTEWVPEILGNDNVFLYRCNVASALSSGNTITVTFSNKADAMLGVDEFSGVSTTEDGENSASGASTTPSVAATISNAATLIVANLEISAAAADGFTEDADATGGASWVSLTTVPRSADIMRGAYKIATSAATQTYNPTLGTSQSWTVALASLVSSAPPADQIPFLVQARRV